MWRELDVNIQGWWVKDVVDPANPATTFGSATMIDVPRPYVAAGTEGTPDWYRTMFNWDAYFTCLGLLVHGRHELVRDLVENYLHLVDLLGYMPNGNQVEISTRSQPPVFPDAIARYLQVCPDHARGAGIPTTRPRVPRILARRSSPDSGRPGHLPGSRRRVTRPPARCRGRDRAGLDVAV